MANAAVELYIFLEPGLTFPSESQITNMKTAVRTAVKNRTGATAVKVTCELGVLTPEKDHIHRNDTGYS